MEASQSVLNLKAIEEELQCAICLEHFNNPLSLPCSHTFCHNCLDDHMKHKTDRGQFLCPTCREPTKARPNGADGFQRNFMASNLVEILVAQENTNKACGVCDDGTKAVHMCIDCHEYHCQVHARDHQKQKVSKSHLVVSLEDVQAGKYENEIRARQVVHCAKHPGEKVRYYCTKCKIPVCIDCVNTAKCPHANQRQDLTTAGENVKSELKECITKLQNKIEEKNKARKEVQQSDKKTATSLISTKKEIEEWYQTLCETIKVSKEKYIESLCQKVKDKSQAFTTFQRDTVKDLKQLKQAEQQAIMAYNYGNPAEMLMSHRAILQQQKKLETEIPNRDVPAGFTTTFVRNQSFRELLKKPEQVLGEVHHTAQLLKVFDTKLPDDTEAPWMLGLVIHKNGDISATDYNNANLKTFSTNGQLKDVFTGDQDYKVISPAGLKLLPNADMLMGNFSEENVVVISPERKVKKVYPVGRGVVGVVMNGGQLITTDQNEVPSLTIWDPESNSVVLEVNKNERGENLFELPNYIEVNSKGHMIVSDTSKNLLYIIDQTGTILCHYKSIADETKLDKPCGVCVDQQDNVYVSDKSNNRILQLTPNGQFSCVVITPEDGLEEPHALTLDNQGNLVVSENTTGKIKVFQFKLM